MLSMLARRALNVGIGLAAATLIVKGIETLLVTTDDEGNKKNRPIDWMAVLLLGGGGIAKLSKSATSAVLRASYSEDRFGRVGQRRLTGFE